MTVVGKIENLSFSSLKSSNKNELKQITRSTKRFQKTKE